MKKQTDHKTIWREIFTPCSAVLISQDRDFSPWWSGTSVLRKAAHNTLINQISPKAGFAHLRQTHFADWNPETGDFGRKQIPRE